MEIFFEVLFDVIWTIQLPLLLMITAIEKFIDTPQEEIKTGIVRLLTSSIFFVVCSWIYTWLFLVENVSLRPEHICVVQIVILWIRFFIASRKKDKEVRKIEEKRLKVELIICVIYVILMYLSLFILVKPSEFIEN